MEMELMVLADIHGNLGMVEKAGEYAADNGIDSFLLLGDFPAYGDLRDGERNLGWCKKTLDLLGKRFGLLAIPGNCDTKHVLKEFDDRGINLHGRVEVVGETSLVGLGGSTPTPFNTPLEMDEEFYYGRLRDLMEEADSDNIVLISHQPPRDTKCDLTREGVHVGSDSLRKIIEEYQPPLTLCSHIHEAGGSRDLIGVSEVCNIGSISEGRFGILKLNKKPSAQIHRFDGDQ